MILDVVCEKVVGVYQCVHHFKIMCKAVSCTMDCFVCLVCVICCKLSAKRFYAISSADLVIGLSSAKADKGINNVLL